MYELREKGLKDKSSKIIIVAEGDNEGGSFPIAQKVKERFPHYDTKVAVLGHIQRGGRPTCADRVLASRLGFAAVEALIGGQRGVMAGIMNYEVAFTPFEKEIKHINALDPAWIRKERKTVVWGRGVTVR